jgi:arabinose-5-phosphate isomerase
MTRKKLGMTCVIDKQEKLLGVITDGDLRRLIQKFGKNLMQKTAQDCMTANPITIDKEDLATKGLNLMEENKITSLIIKNKKGEIEGIVHLHDLWRTEMF